MEVNFTEINLDKLLKLEPDSCTSDTSFGSNIESCNLFQVYLDADSENGDILIKAYNPCSTFASS